MNPVNFVSCVAAPCGAMVLKSSSRGGIETWGILMLPAARAMGVNDSKEISPKVIQRRCIACRLANSTQHQPTRFAPTGRCAQGN